MSAGGNLSQTQLSIIKATKSIKRSLSRENTPVKSQLDFDDNEVPEVLHYPTPTPILKKTPRKMPSTTQKGELLGSITTRRSVRLSITPRKLYKE